MKHQWFLHFKDSTEGDFKKYSNGVYLFAVCPKLKISIELNYCEEYAFDRTVEEIRQIAFSEARKLIKRFYQNRLSKKRIEKKICGKLYFSDPIS